MENFAPTQFAPHQNVDGWNGKETQVFPRFYLGQKMVSAQDGVPTVKNIEMVEIFQAGEKDTQIEEVNVLHQRRWPRHWDAFKAGQAQIADGTPLELLFPANPQVVADLKSKNIHTIQALAGVPDSAGATVPFLTEWKKKAETFLDGIEKGKGFHALEKKLEDAELKVIEQDDLIKTLNDRLTLLEKSKKEKE